MKIISELCQNHNGDRSILESMIEYAACDSDILKIQSIKADTLTKRKEYEDFRPYKGEFSRLKSIELSWEDEKFFIEKCKEHDVESMTTLFTPKHIDYFNSLGYDNLKLSGYSIPAFDYGKKLSDLNFKTLYFSASSLSLNELSKTVNNLKKMEIDFCLLGCTCVYPTPLEKANLQNIDLTRDGKVSMTPDMLSELRRFSNLTISEQYNELNEFNKQQIFNHKYYRGKFQ
jgi:sialic acid synthase SpsE